MGGGLERFEEEEGMWYYFGEERLDGSWRSVVRVCLVFLVFFGYRVIFRGSRYFVWGCLVVISCFCGSWFVCLVMKVFERRIGSSRFIS